MQRCGACGEQWWDSHCCPKQNPPLTVDGFFAEAKRLNLRVLGTPEETRAALDAKDAEIERLRAALWQPIEAAPEDMTEPVVVRWVNGDGEEARRFDYREDGCWMGWHDHAEHVRMIGGRGVSETPPYEHWLPLPAAPQSA